MADHDDHEESASERFKELLQPIRDLAVNWDIDVAAYLEDYLGDLENLTITLGEELRNAVTDPLVDDGEVNFAEAALLIQVYFNPSAKLF